MPFWFLLKKIFHRIFSFFIIVIIDLYFLIPAVIAHMFNPDLELAITKWIPIKEVKAEMETYSVTVEAKISKCLLKPKNAQIILLLTH